jgi:hypothetical protein
LPDKKGKKKNVQAKLDTSPPKNGSDVEDDDATILVADRPALRTFSSNERSPPTSDILAGLTLMLEDDEEEQDSIALYLRKTGELTVLFLYQWQNAKEYPELTPMDFSEEIVNQYIERVLSSSHKRKDNEGVHWTLREINVEDKAIRSNDRYVRMLYLRLGKALEPHTEIGRANAANNDERGRVYMAAKCN